tara:strand:- start:629 stop:949 length:321 start_codon:yes stop_codon:yes gene_type:complete
MPRLEDFREMIDGVDDPSVLESGQTLLREMMEINNIRRRLDDLESNITNGGKAIFYFFAEELDEDELVFAAERISGRIKRIQRIEASEKEKKEKDSNIEESNSKDK